MTISKQGIRWGIITGLITIVVYIIAYLISYEMFFHAGIGWATFLVYLFGMYMASKSARQEFLTTHDLADEPYSFNLALQPPFVTFLLSNILYYIFYYIMFNFVNTDLAEIQKGIMMETMEIMQEKMSSFFNEDTMDEMVEAIENEDLKVTIGSTLKALALSLLWGFLLSAIYALIFKKNQIQKLS